MTGMLRAEVNGLSVAYERAGAGPALILLHGFLLDSRMWRPQLENLPDHFTVIAWDAPGAGQSSDPPDTFGIGDWAECLAGLLDAAGVDRAHILGLSWGGVLAQEFYRRYSSRVLSLVLADTYAGWKGSLPEPIVQARLATCIRDASLPGSELVSRYLPGMFSESATREVRDELASIMSDFHPVGFRLMAMSLAHTDTRDLLPNIKVPTLLVWGDADERSPMGVGNQIRDALPTAKLAIIRGAGHISNLEAPVQFNAEVRDFCLSTTRLSRRNMCLVEPSGGAPISGVQVPGELYWVLKSPAPLAGMQYPRADFPWSHVKMAGFSRVVSLRPGKYHPAPLTVLLAERLEDLAHGGLPRSAGTEAEAVKRAVVATVSSLRAGEGVVIHCEGGRGRTGTVLGCVLRELGYEGGVVVDYLDRVHKARGNPGWPESRWQEELVRAWKPDSRPPARG